MLKTKLLLVFCWLIVVLGVCAVSNTQAREELKSCSDEEQSLSWDFKCAVGEDVTKDKTCRNISASDTQCKGKYLIASGRDQSHTAPKKGSRITTVTTVSPITGAAAIETVVCYGYETCKKSPGGLFCEYDTTGSAYQPKYTTTNCSDDDIPPGGGGV